MPTIVIAVEHKDQRWYIADTSTGNWTMDRGSAREFFSEGQAVTWLGANGFYTSVPHCDCSIDERDLLILND